MPRPPWRRRSRAGSSCWAPLPSPPPGRIRGSSLSWSATLPDPEALAAQRVDVVREADREERQHEDEADQAGLLHDAERDRLAAQLLGDGPEDVTAVERQEREQVDDRQ